MPARETVRQEQQHGAYGRDVEWLAGAASVTADQIALQLRELAGGDLDATQMPKSGGDTVNGAPLRADVLDEVPRRAHPLVCARRQPYVRPRARDGDYARDAEPLCPHAPDRHRFAARSLLFVSRVRRLRVRSLAVPTVR